MKVAFLSIDDWANLGFTLSKSLRTLGVDSFAYARNRHLFVYPKQAEILSDDFRLKDCDTVVFMHSTFVKTNTDLSGKRIFVFHGGSTYRNNPKGINNFFNKIVVGSIIQDASLLGLGAKNEYWLPPPVDTDYIQPSYTVNKPLVVGHYPSHVERKGTVVINEAVKKVLNDIKFSYSTSSDGKKINRIGWVDNLKRMSKCDIYIERLHPKDRNYTGDWGITALEAAALGCVVVTNFKSKERYEKEFNNECPFYIISSPGDLEIVLRVLLTMPEESLIIERKRTREWVEKNHGLQCVGKRLFNILKGEKL